MIRSAFGESIELCYPRITEFWFVHKPQNLEIEPNQLARIFDFFGFESTLLARQLHQERTQMEAQ